MKLNSILLILIIGFLSIGATIHDHHVGTTEIKYSESSETYQITLKLFTDDLENAVLKDSGEIIKLGIDEENSNSDLQIFSYLDKHFSIKFPEGETVNLTKIGRETELDITWVYYESQKTKPMSALTVNNSIFMELHPDQTHIVNIEQNGATKSTLLHISKTGDLLNL